MILSMGTKKGLPRQDAYLHPSFLFLLVVCTCCLQLLSTHSLLNPTKSVLFCFLFFCLPVLSYSLTCHLRTSWLQHNLIHLITHSFSLSPILGPMTLPQKFSNIFLAVEPFFQMGSCLKLQAINHSFYIVRLKITQCKSSKFVLFFSKLFWLFIAFPKNFLISMKFLPQN